MWFEPTYTFLGGLGIFFFGMKTLSESLQSLSGGMIRRVITALTLNRFMAVAVGVFVTTLVQSSSVSTVMVIGLVNAKLMELTQAIGIIFGANIGTTITGWIIAIKVGKYGLLLVGLGIFPLLFAKRQQWKSIGSVFVALGFIFMGLEFMSSAFKPLRGSETFLSLMQYFQADTHLSVLACVAIGAILTMVIQSSSAMLGITIALASTGSISFLTAAALVMGENIGTTITAMLASIGGNSSAKRAAKAHALFNILAVAVLFPFFWLWTGMVEWAVAGEADLLAADGSKPNVAAHIAASHTMFNVTATILFLPFLNHLAKFVTWLTPAPKMAEVPHLKYLTSTPEFESPAIAFAMAEKETQNLADITGRTLKLVGEYILSEHPEKRIQDKISHYEKVTDSIQAEITVFVSRAQEPKISASEAALAGSLIRMAHELETIADYCLTLVRTRDRMTKSDETLTPAGLADLKMLYDQVWDYFQKVSRSLTEETDWDLRKFAEASDEITKNANEIRNRHRERLQKAECSPLAGMIYSDLTQGLRKIKAHSFNVIEAIAAREV